MTLLLYSIKQLNKICDFKHLKMQKKENVYNIKM